MDSFADYYDRLIGGGDITSIISISGISFITIGGSFYYIGGKIEELFDIGGKISHYFFC